MPVLGQGILPTGAVGSELQALTRRAFMPTVVVQIGKAHVTVSSMLQNGEGLTGGVSPITTPVQYAEMGNAVWTDYAGGGTAAMIQPGVKNAEYNLKALVYWLAFPLFESLAQLGAEILPVAWARVNGASVALGREMSERLFAAIGTNTTLQPWSLFDLVSNANPSQGNVGGIDRTVDTWWQATQFTAASLNTGTTTWTRTNFLAAVMKAMAGAGGKKPSYAIVSPGTWATLASDVIGAERYLVSSTGHYGEGTQGVQIAFPALNIGQVPIYADFYMTDNTKVLFVDADTLAYYYHENAIFTPTELASLLPQFQLGYVMAIVTLVEAATSGPRYSAQGTGFTAGFSI